MSKLRGRSSAIFLLNLETRELYGVFEAEGQPGLDIEPEAWAGQSYNGRRTSRFPAQVSGRQSKGGSGRVVRSGKLMAYRAFSVCVFTVPLHHRV